jgi:hypothetical protein
MNVSSGTRWNYVRSLAEVPEEATEQSQTFTPHFAIIQWFGRDAAKVLWTTNGSTITLSMRFNDRIMSR